MSETNFMKAETLMANSRSGGIIHVLLPLYALYVLPFRWSKRLKKSVIFGTILIQGSTQFLAIFRAIMKYVRAKTKPFEYLINLFQYRREQ